jgi:anthraniloyl-CoA monooxygenase
VVAADGINSRTRERSRTVQAEHRAAAEHFCLDGLDRPMDAFNFFFRETEHGIFIAHCYQYQPGRSTWVMETDPETSSAPASTSSTRTRRRVSSKACSPTSSTATSSITNRSIWRNFPDHPLRALDRRQHRADRRRQGDGAFLHRLGHQARDGGRRSRSTRRSAPPAAATCKPRSRISRSARREEVEKTQHSADVSLVWFEHVERFWDMDPTRFAFGLMTRSKAITYDNLALRAPRFVKLIDKVVARDVAGRASTVDTASRVPMFQPFRLRGMTLPTAWWCRRCASTRRRRHADRLAHRALRLARASAAPA